MPRSPHNAFLGAVAEGGWLYGSALLAMALVFLSKFLFPLLRKSWQCQSLPCELGLFLALAVYLLADALVAFPTDNAFPFVATAFTVALGASLTQWPVILQRIVVIPRFALVSVGVCLMLFAAAKHVADAAYAAPNVSAAQKRLACRLMPEHLEVCLKAAESWLNAGKPQYALERVESNLRRQPLHFPSLAAASEILTVLGQTQKACAHMRAYKALLPESGRFDRALEMRCTGQ